WIWQNEFAANGWTFTFDKNNNGYARTVLDATTPDVGALAYVRNLKRELKWLVDERVNDYHGLVPKDVASWWMDWEHHDWKPTKVLWDALHPFVELKTLNVSIKPDDIPPDKPVVFTVTADDGGIPVNDAEVRVDGKKVGLTGKPISFMFKTKTK